MIRAGCQSASMERVVWAWAPKPRLLSWPGPSCPSPVSGPSPCPEAESFPPSSTGHAPHPVGRQSHKPSHVLHRLALEDSLPSKVSEVGVQVPAHLQGGI